MTMRLFALAAIGVTTFAATMIFGTSNANAVVYCVEGVYRAGCVVRPGVRGVARRTTRRVVRRRSDMTLKHDISLLGHLDNGLGFYRFSYNDSDKVYVGVMAQEVQTVMPAAVVRGSDGYLRPAHQSVTDVWTNATAQESSAVLAWHQARQGVAERPPCHFAARAHQGGWCHSAGR